MQYVAGSRHQLVTECRLAFAHLTDLTNPCEYLVVVEVALTLYRNLVEKVFLCRCRIGFTVGIVNMLAQKQLLGPRSVFFNMIFALIIPY